MTIILIVLTLGLLCESLRLHKVNKQIENIKPGDRFELIIHNTIVTGTVLNKKEQRIQYINNNNGDTLYVDPLLPMYRGEFTLLDN